MTLFLVRHASAVERSRWSSDDLERPLDERGRIQAESITDYLTGRPVRAVWSSQAARCTQTVAGVAAVLGLDVDVRRQLTEGARPAEALELLHAEAEREGDLVVCSHGDLIPEMLNRLLREGMAVQGPRGCEKGSIWELEADGGRIVLGRYVAKP